MFQEIGTAIHAHICTSNLQTIRTVTGCTISNTFPKHNLEIDTVGARVQLQASTIIIIYH